MASVAEESLASVQPGGTRWYEKEFPEVDELVMVQVKEIASMGAYVRLLEYGNIEGMILLSELSRRRIRSINKLIRVGKNEAVMVLRVDKEKGYIDLSKRRVSPEEVAKCEEKVGSRGHGTTGRESPWMSLLCNRLCACVCVCVCTVGV